jgi:hypothetical protein
MIRSINETTATVPPEEVARRIAEMRQLSWERRLPPVVVYHPEHQLCPWSGCDYRIAGIHFQLDKWADPVHYPTWLHHWWLGDGFVGRCPGCGRQVLFGVLGKRAVADVGSLSAAVLPNDWHRLAHLLPVVSQQPAAVARSELRQPNP